MIQCALRANVQQDVGDVVANGKSRVGWLWSLFSGNQVERPLKTRI